jgi:hypothetical protein
MAWDWQPDLANWSMYTPWPFTPLFQELGDKVEVFDYSKYNFVTPIMKPAAMDRAELLDGVMNNYRRFYMKKALFHYPWRGTGFRRRYLLGCLKAFLKAGFQRTFYDLGKAGYWGPQTKDNVDFHFDELSQLEGPAGSGGSGGQGLRRRRPADGRPRGSRGDTVLNAPVVARPPAGSRLAKIGPNSVLQLVPLLDERLGQSRSGSGPHEDLSGIERPAQRHRA